MAHHGNERIVGVDVSKDRLDLFDWDAQRPTSIANEAAEIDAWLARLTLPIRLAIEPTNRYHLELAERASALGHAVYLIDPHRLSHYRAGVGLDFLGEKLDSVGPSPVPAGTDNLGVPNYEMIAICEQDGYFRDGDGTPWVIVEEYFTDRATGTVQKFGVPVRLGPEVENLLGNRFFAWADAFERGIIDFGSAAPIAAQDRARTAEAMEVVINLLANDSDLDGDALRIDGIVQPRHGLVFANGDGTVTYRPDFDFTGEDRFRYWVTDDHGHFTPAEVVVQVEDGMVFVDSFE